MSLILPPLAKQGIDSFTQKKIPDIHLNVKWGGKNSQKYPIVKTLTTTLTKMLVSVCISLEGMVLE